MINPSCLAIQAFTSKKFKVSNLAFGTLTSGTGVKTGILQDILL